MPKTKKVETQVTKKKAEVAEKPIKAVKKTVNKPAKVKKTTSSEEQIQVQPNPEKKDIIVQFQVKEGDTGSPEVQIALLTKRIEKLVMHLKTNPSDNHSRRGLLGIVSKRRRLLNYLEKRDEKRYKDVSKKLSLSK